MFADIVGSTTLYETLGDEVAARCVSNGIDRMRGIAEAGGGEIENVIGDEILSVFDNPDDAVSTAISLHHDFRMLPVHDDISIKLRIGIHYGPVLGKGKSLSGDAVNTAARIASIASADKVIISEQLQSKLSLENACMTRKFDITEIKGKKGHILLYECVWDDTNLTVAKLTGKPHKPGDHQLILNHQSNKVIMDSEDGPVIIGRGLSSNLLIDADLVSRVHAKCVYRRGKFILVDQSTNGTYLKQETGREVYLRREEMPLIGHGYIGTGESTAEDTGQVIEFFAT